MVKRTKDDWTADALLMAVIVIGTLIFLSVTTYGCAHVEPRVDLMPSGIVVINKTPFVRSADVEAIAVCVADVWGLPRDKLLQLTIIISSGYAVPCKGSIAMGCYDKYSRTVRVANEPMSVGGGVGYGYAPTLDHEVQHYARHMLTGDPGDNSPRDLPAGGCY